MLQEATCLLAPGRWTRLVARGRHVSLDRAIAAGADPASSAPLAARAAQLASMPMRRRVAADLERMVVSAGDTCSRWRTLPARRAVGENQAELLELATTLRDSGATYARGVADLELLVTDGAGPAYTDRTGTLLARRLRQARGRLSGADPGA
jgi:hypothetical protein